MRVGFRKGLGAGVALACALASAPAQQTNFWNANAGGQWTNVNLWADTGFYPDGVGDVAQFTFDIGANRAITLNDADGFITNGLLIVGDGSHGYRFSVGSGTQWIFDDTDDLVEIRVTAASNTAGRNHMIFGAFTINDDLLVDHRVAGVNRAFRITNSIFEGAAGLDLFKVGVGQLNIEGTAAYSGMTSVDGGVLQLTNAGVLSASTNIVVHQGTLEINNAGNNIGDRIGDAAVITSRGGGLTFSHDAAAATAFSETLDQLDFRSGNTLIQMTAGAADGSSALLFSNATAAIVRSGAGATARIEAPGLGTNAQNEILLVPGAGLPAPQNGIIPWVVVKDGVGGTGADYNLATTNTGTGGHIGITALTAYQQNPESIWIAADNVRPLGDENLSGNRALNALVLDDGIDIRGDAGSANDRRLDFNTAGGAAAILQTGGTSLVERGTFNANNDVILNFGNNQGIFHTIGTLQIARANSNEQIRGTNGFVKAGPGTLILDSVSSKDPTAANAMSGDFYINEGTLELRRAGSGGATTLRLDGGDLRLASGADQNYGNSVIVDESGSIIVAHTNASTVALDMTLSNVTIAAGRTLTINRDAANFSGANQAYRVVARDVALLGDATIDVRAGKGTGDGTFQVESISDGGGNYDFAVVGNNVIRAQLLVNNGLTLGGDLVVGNNALLRVNDGGTNVAGNINLFGGLLGLSIDFARELGAGAGQVQLTGDAGLQAGFSSFSTPSTVRIEDGSGGLTNLIWGASDTFNPGILTLQQDDAASQLTLANSIDFNAAVSNVTRTINVHADVALIQGTLTNSGAFVTDFVKGGAGTLWLTNGFHWDGSTRVAAGILRVPDVASLPGGNLSLSPANAVGVLESTGLFTRALGSNANEVTIVGGGNAGQNSRPGFSAFGGDLTVDLGGDGTGTGPQLIWNSADFDPAGPSTNNGALLLNTANATGTLRFMNDMDLNGEGIFLSGPEYRRIEVNGGMAILGGDITNSQAGLYAIGLLKRGAGILALEGDNAYDGLTQVAAGTLLVNGTQRAGGAFSVIDSATLGGTGLISAPVWVTNGATVAPGSLGIGNLTVQGNVDIEGILSIEIDAAGAGFVDLLSVTGILDISAATLNFVTNGITLDDTAYIFASYGTLVTNDPTAGFGAVNFLPDGYQLDYNYLGGNQIALVIPEPTTWALLILGGLTLLAAWRRR